MRDTAVSKALGSERAFVGAIINGDAHAADHGLTTKDFSDDFCRQVFAACTNLESSGKTPDLVTLSDTAPELDLNALIELTQQASILGSLVEQHAANIREASQRRRIADTLIRAAQAAQNPSKPLSETLPALRGWLDKADGQLPAEGDTDGTDAIVDFLLHLEDDTPEKTIPTGISSLDFKMRGGLRDGELYIIGARPSVGKSAMMSAWAVSAIRNGFRALYINLEMKNRDNVSRMAAEVSGGSMTRITNKALLSKEDHAQIIEAFQHLPGSKFRFNTQATTPSAVRRAALRARASMGLDIIFVDYLQLLSPDQRHNNRADAVGEISRALKLLAMELGVPVVAAAQLNRTAANSNNVPRLCDLRESGSIEQDADAVILLHRPDDQINQLIQNIEVCVAKQRQGTCGTTTLVFDGARMRFAPLEYQREEAV